MREKSDIKFGPKNRNSPARGACQCNAVFRANLAQCRNESSLLNACVVENQLRGPPALRRDGKYRRNRDNNNGASAWIFWKEPELLMSGNPFTYSSVRPPREFLQHQSGPDAGRIIIPNDNGQSDAFDGKNQFCETNSLADPLSIRYMSRIFF